MATVIVIRDGAFFWVLIGPQELYSHGWDWCYRKREVSALLYPLVFPHRLMQQNAPDRCQLIHSHLTGLQNCESLHLCSRWPSLPSPSALRLSVTTAQQRPRKYPPQVASSIKADWICTWFITVAHPLVEKWHLCNSWLNQIICPLHSYYRRAEIQGIKIQNIKTFTSGKRWCVYFKKMYF